MLTFHGLRHSVLLKKGAEASLFVANWNSRQVVMKRRIPKRYRHSMIDEEIRTYRTIHESQLLHSAKEAGVPTPAIVMVDLAESTIVMEFIEGEQLKRALEHFQPEDRQKVCRDVGQLIGRLHANKIIHGDLTTSNMILTDSGTIVFVDFGLGEKSEELEHKGVDLHLMKRAFQSTHYRYAAECFQAVIEGYAAVVGRKEAEEALAKVGEIERRGRYITERKGVGQDKTLQEAECETTEEAMEQ